MVWVILLIVVLVILFLLAAGHIFYEMVLNAKNDKEIFTGPYTISKSLQKENEIFAGYHPKDVFMESHDGLQLHGIEAVTDPEKWVILVHGYMGRNSEMIDAANMFLKQGYSVLLPSLRCHARSQGDTISMGYWESRDLVEWIQYLVKEHPQCSIYLLGVSMGAASVMMALGNSLPENVKAAVEDCGYTSAWDEFGYQLKRIFKLPKFPILHTCELVTRFRGKYKIRKASPIKAIQKSNVPILFIHGDADDFVPTHMVYELYDMANYPKQLCIIEGGEHALARIKDPNTYYSSVFGWFEQFA